MLEVVNATPRRGLNVNHRRENNFLRAIALIDLTQGKCAASLRIYGTNARNYACLWVHHEPVYCSGSGWAGGYGYHRPSAAAATAFAAAGLPLSEDIGGRGDGVMRDAMLALAAFLNIQNPMIHEAHP